MSDILDVYGREVLDSRGNPTVEVEAPEGTIARPKLPSSSTTSTSTVGLPRLSSTSRP